MSYLLRRTRRAVWTGEKSSRESAMQEFSRKPEDTDGLSVYEVKNDDDRMLVIAAIACLRESCERVDLIEMDRNMVEQFGRVDSTPEKGTTPIPGANKLHCSLDWDAAALSRMAEELFDQRAVPLQFSSVRVRAALRLIDPTTIDGEGAQAFVRLEQAKP